MSNILLLKDEEGASGDELNQILLRFAKLHNAKCVYKHVKELDSKDIEQADALICIRGDTPYMRYILRAAKKMKKFIVYFLDDALKDLPDNTFRYPKRKKWHLECLKLCDVLLTTNPLIEEDYRDLIQSNRTSIINTAVSNVYVKKNTELGRKLRIVYAGSEWHIENYKAILEPVIISLLNRNKENVELYFVGFDPQIIDFNENIHIVPKMKLDEYQEYMREMDFDIGLAPLNSSFFSQRKYFNKFIEYTRYGICGLYSDVYPYKFVVKDGINGFLVKNEPNLWLKTIQQVIDDNRKRHLCIKNAQEYLVSNHNDSVIFERLEKEIPELLIKCENCSVKSTFQYQKAFLYYPFWIKEKFYMLFYSIKKGGIRSTIQRLVKKKR